MRRFEIGLAIDAAHSFTAASGYRFEQHRVAMRAREFAGLLVSNAAIRTRSYGCACRDRDPPRRGLRAHSADRFRRRADEHDAGALTCGGELRILAQEAVTGMDRLGAVFLSRRDDGLRAQTNFRRGRRSEAPGLIGHANV